MWAISIRMLIKFHNIQLTNDEYQQDTVTQSHSHNNCIKVVMVSCAEQWKSQLEWKMRHAPNRTNTKKTKNKKKTTNNNGKNMIYEHELQHWWVCCFPYGPAVIRIYYFSCCLFSAYGFIRHHISNTIDTIDRRGRQLDTKFMDRSFVIYLGIHNTDQSTDG